jgi:hypothetical protein
MEGGINVLLSTIGNLSMNCSRAVCFPEAKVWIETKLQEGSTGFAAGIYTNVRPCAAQCGSGDF